MASASKAEGAAGWFFQANPDTWRIDDFLASAKRDTERGMPVETLWRLKPDSYARFTHVEQPVYIWRAAGSGRRSRRRIAGIAARAHIIGPAEPRDDVNLEYRTTEGQAKLQPRQVRVPIRVDFVLDRLITREALASRSDLTQGLGELSILHWARQLTTYPVFPDEIPRLERLVDIHRAGSR